MVDRIVAALTELPGRVVLVGHSLAGMAISAAAENVLDRATARALAPRQRPPFSDGLHWWTG